MISRKYFSFAILLVIYSMPLFAGVVSMSFKDTDIRQIYKIICKIGKINGVINKVIRNRITVKCKDVPAEELVVQLAEDNMLGIVKIGDIFYMYDPKYNYSHDKAIQKINENLDQMQQEGHSTMYSADFRDKNINIILKDIAEKAGFEYRTSKGVVGNADLHVSEVLASDAFAALAISKGYSVKRRENVWFVGYGRDFWLD